MKSLLDWLDAIERDKPRSVYCTQNNEDCATCSLSSYGMDCHGKPIQEQSGGPFPCPMCQGQKYIQAFADTNGVCPRCGGAKFVDTLEY